MNCRRYGLRPAMNGQEKNLQSVVNTVRAFDKTVRQKGGKAEGRGRKSL